MAKAKLCAVDGCDKPVHVKGWCRAHYLRWYRHGDPLLGARSLSAKGEPFHWVEGAVDHKGDGCLIWPYARTGSGYGQLVIDGRRVLAHRWMCEAVHGPAPTPEHEAAHSCGKGHEGCIHPGHLRWATPKENAEDRIVHGTNCEGERSPNAVLSEGDVLKIYGLKGSGISQRKIADMFGVSYASVSWIMTGRSWAWLTGEPKR